ncbi:MAG: S9 family peptidase [Gemmatimonadetes bacterium]|nr:S9 family peptidase [Gemmatimonadota bacterium]
MAARHCFAAAAVAALAALLPPTGVTAQETHAEDLLTVGHYLDMERVGDPRISPDGTQIVFAKSWVNRMEDRFDSEIRVMDSDGGRQRFLVEGSSPRWSPDGTRIAYLAPGDDGGQQIHVRWMDAEGSTTQVTRELQTPSNFKTSPDGAYIHFQRLVPHSNPWPIDLPAPPEGANWTPPPRIIDRIHYRYDRIGFLEEGFTHLFRVPSGGGTARQLTSGEWNAGSTFVPGVGNVGYDVTPDGGTLLFDGNMEDADNLYRESHIYALDLASGDIRQLTSERGPWARPMVSPDGRRIAYTGFPWTSQTYKTTELYVMDLDGGNARLVSGDLDRDIGAMHWSDDSGGVFFTAGDRGTQNVHFATIDGEVSQVTEGVHMLSLISATRGGQAVGTLTSPHKPGDVVAFDLNSPGTITQLTEVNADVLANKRLGDVEEIWYESTGGTQVQGWIVKPPDFDPARSYPLILHIHGGPHAMYNVAFSYPYQNFAANGYVTLYTNPRGSTGYGTDFGNAIDNGYPSVDYDDLMAGVDALIGRGYINEDQMYVTGCSGGGVLSSWVIGQTTRFAAAGVRCPVINWMSFAGTADITVWGYYRYHGYPWDNPDKYLEHSPLMYVENVTTPTILITGEDDLRTPMAQTEEYYQALKQLGVPTKMLRFHDEAHGTGSKPSNFMRTQLYLMKWFEEYGGQPRMTSEG